MMFFKSQMAYSVHKLL